MAWTFLTIPKQTLEDALPTFASGGLPAVAVLAQSLQRTRAATEALYLLMKHALDDLGYRRLEWKCDAANARSMRAAERLGFLYEGTFRQHRIVKGRNRDTAWFSIIDAEWAAVRAALEAWLAPDNFDPDGDQLRRLQDIRAGL